MTVEDLEGPGGFCELYDSEVISTDAYRALKHGDLHLFEKLTGGTGFIHYSHEDAVGRNGFELVSTDKEYDHDLREAQESDENFTNGKLIVRVLEAPDEKIGKRIIAACAWLQPPKRADDRVRRNGEYFQKLYPFLEKGVTGGDMRLRYVLGQTPESNISLLANGVYMNIIVAKRYPRHAATIIGWDAAESIAALNDNDITEPQNRIEHIWLYHLGGILITPPAEGREDRLVPLTKNRPSAGYFETRGTEPFAYDFSAKGPVAMREFDGVQHAINVEWVWRRGGFDEFRRICQQKKEEQEQKYGALPFGGR